jgi:hypothetical protein
MKDGKKGNADYNKQGLSSTVSDHVIDLVRDRP